MAAAAYLELARIRAPYLKQMNGRGVIKQARTRRFEMTDHESEYEVIHTDQCEKRSGPLVAHAVEHLVCEQRGDSAEHISHPALTCDSRRGELAVRIGGVVVDGQENVVDAKDDEDDCKLCRRGSDGFISSRIF